MASDDGSPPREVGSLARSPRGIGRGRGHRGSVRRWGIRIQRSRSTSRGGRRQRLRGLARLKGLIGQGLGEGQACRVRAFVIR